jgi:hypothetical protein
MSLGKSTYIDCFKGTVGKRLLTGCLLQSLQQLTGVNFICEYILVDASEHALTKSSLLRNPVLQERGFPGSVRHLSHHQLCQCVLHISRTISSREDGTSQLASHGCHWHGFLSMYVLVYHLPGKARTNSSSRRRSHYRYRSRNDQPPSPTRVYRVRVHLHFLLRQLVGPSRMVSGICTRCMRHTLTSCTGSSLVSCSR